MRAFSGIATAALVAVGLAASAQASNIENGKALYELYCTQCHGLSGDGKGMNASAMTVQPRNHNDRAEMSTRSDEELFKAIKHGGQAVNKSVLMPNWDGNMTDAEIEDVIQYLRLLCCQE